MPTLSSTIWLHRLVMAAIALVLGSTNAHAEAHVTESVPTVETTTTVQIDFCAHVTTPGSIAELVRRVKCEHVLPSRQQVVDALLREPDQAAAPFQVVHDLLTAARLGEALALQDQLLNATLAAGTPQTDQWPLIRYPPGTAARLGSLQKQLLEQIRELGMAYNHHFHLRFITTAVGPWVEV